MIILLKRLLALTGIVLGCFSILGGSPAPLGAADHLIHTFQLHPWERANAVAFSPGSDQLAVGSSLGVHFYQLPAFDEIRMIRTEEWVRGIAFSPDGTMVAGALFDYTIRLWRTSDGSQLETLAGHTDWVRSVAFSSDGAILASASDDNTVRLWRVLDGALLYSLENGTKGVRSIAFSSDDSLIAAGTADGLIHLWRVQDGVLLNTLEGHKGWVRTVAFSHDGKLLASGAFDATARIWRVADGALLHELKGHTSSVLSVAFTPDDKVLATGSVDATVRLWGVENGQLRNILEGHTGFIFGIAVSPDGALLASGAGDGTVRLWDISGLSPSVGTPPAGKSGDCRVCHHPPSTTIAPAVLEVRCEACHTGGAALNWCPMFPRLPKAPFSTPGYTVSTNKAGIPIPSGTLSVEIVAPGNGETFYVKPEFVAPLHVTGRVAYLETELSKINVYLEVWSGVEKLGALPTRLHPDGSFSFNLGVNPGGGTPVKSSEQIDAGSIVCDNCHAKYNADLYLPQGELRLIVRAAGPGNEQAWDERWVNVDVSTVGELEVTVIDASTGEPVPGVSVQASTRLYEWRPRSSSAITAQNGVAILNPEILTQASTTYSISVPRQVAGGTYYEGQQEVEVTYPPDAPAMQSAVIRVRLQRGEINGRLEGQGAVSLGPVPVWAVQLPAGPAYKTETAQRSFSFVDLPVAEYFVFPGIEGLLSGNFGNYVQTADLNSSPKTALGLPVSLPTDIAVMKGNVLDGGGGWLPFAWLTISDGEVRPVDLADGAWTLAPEPSDQRTIVVSAPGYYSQAIGLVPGANSNGSIPVSLVRRTGMRALPWGTGEILLPPETVAVLDASTLSLESGWVWGSNGREQILNIDTPEAGITWTSGRFALARLPNQTAWFYLFDGLAEVRSKKLDETILLQPGTMVALQENGRLSAIPYDPAVFAALNPLDEAPVSPVWEPTFSASLRKRLVEVGLMTAQVVTYVTYALVLISIAVIPLAALSLRIRRRNRPEIKDQHGHER